MADHFVGLLCDQVDNAHDANDLARIMPHIGMDLDEVREMMKCKIRALNTATARRAVFHVVSIDELLPMDTLQHLISYNHFTNMQRVSKSFKRCFEQNQEIAKRARQAAIEKYAHHFSPDISYNPLKNKTYVVRPFGEPLMESAAALGDAVILKTNPVYCFFDPERTSGDRIFIQNGRHELHTPWTIENQDVQIIGLGENVEIYCRFGHYTNNDPMALTLKGKSNVFLKNISFTFEKNTDCCVNFIDVSGQSTLWMDHCEIRDADDGIHIREDCCGHFKSCTFLSRDVGIHIYEQRDVTSIIGCTFGSHQYGCIYTSFPLRCIGNNFYSNLAAIVCYDEKDRQPLIDRSAIEGNVYDTDQGFIVDRAIEVEHFSLRSWECGAYTELVPKTE